jgi:predicted membrane channel-forming protein YqfA (hemolysin III family)
MWRRHRDMFSPVRHILIPLLGSAVLVVPFVELCRPGQPRPYNTFPYVVLALLVVAVAAAAIVVRRHPTTGTVKVTSP